MKQTRVEVSSFVPKNHIVVSPDYMKEKHLFISIEEADYLLINCHQDQEFEVRTALLVVTHTEQMWWRHQEKIIEVMKKIEELMK